MSDAASFSRQWLLLRKLCARFAAWSLQDLAREFSVSQKTISRDLNVLRGVGFPVCESTGRYGKKSWRCDTDSILSGLSLTFDEVAALYLGRRFLEPLAGTFIWDAAQSAFRKIRAGLGDEQLQYLEQCRHAFCQTTFGNSDYSDRAATIDTLMMAMEDSKVAQLLYHSLSSDSPKSVQLHPYGLIYHRKALYLVAFVPEYEGLRHYKVDRIHDIELLNDETFNRIDGFHLERHLQSTFGIYHNNGQPHDIRIHFQPEAARYVQEHHWHDSQKITEHPDGSIYLDLQLTELTEIKSWVLSFGAKAKVEKPEELREMIATVARKLASHYRTVRNR